MTRIGLNYNLSLINSNMSNASTGYSRALEPLATGKTINHLGDKPSQLPEFIRLQNEQSRKEQYVLNINTAQTRVGITDNVLSEVNEVVNQVYELALQSNNGTLNTSDLANITARLTTLKSEVTDLANTKVGNVYLFSGFKSSTQPFTGSAGVFNGDTNIVSVKVTQTREIDVSVNGSNLFTGGGGNVDIFDTIDDLVTAVGAQNSANIDTAIGLLQTYLTQVSTARSTLGSSMQQLDAAKSFLDNQDIANSERISVISDTDMARASADLSYREFAMQSAYAVAKRVMEISLSSFLN